jgi:hypothetical protein
MGAPATRPVETIIQSGSGLGKRELATSRLPKSTLARRVIASFIIIVSHG